MLFFKRPKDIEILTRIFGDRLRLSEINGISGAEVHEDLIKDIEEKIEGAHVRVQKREVAPGINFATITVAVPLVDDGSIIFTDNVEKNDYLKFKIKQTIRESEFYKINKHWPIRVSCPHQGTEDLQFDGFNIHVWGVPPNYLLIARQTPMNLFEIPVPCRDGCHPAVDDGCALVSIKDKSYIIGQMLDEHNFYIYHDIIHMGGDRTTFIPNELKLLQEILNRLAAELLQEDLKARFNNLKDKIRVAGIKNLNELMRKKILSEEEYLTSQITNLKAALNAISNDLYDKITLLPILEYQLNGIKSAPGINSEEVLKRMENVKGIADIKITGETIIATTENIFIKTPDNKILDIGIMQIFIKGNTINFRNLTRKGTGKDYNIIHPHIDMYGNACWGNILPTITEMLAKFQFPELLFLTVKFLKSLNDEDIAGKTAHKYWPIRSEEKVIPETESIKAEEATAVETA